MPSRSVGCSQKSLDRLAALQTDRKTRQQQALEEGALLYEECLNLETLAASGAKEFVFVALPLKIQGGTGSPIRPVALVDHQR